MTKKNVPQETKRRQPGWRRLLKIFEHRATLTFTDACTIASEILRNVARKYCWAADRDEYDLLNTCLREKVNGYSVSGAI